MARKTSSKPLPIEPPQVPAEQGLKLVQAQIEKGKQLLASGQLSSDAHSSWELVTRNILEKAFGVNSPNVTSITHVGKFGAFPMSAPPGFWENHRANSLQTQLRKLEGLVEVLRTECQLDQGEPATLEVPHTGRRIFLVHGHDEGVLHEAARFLEKLEQDVIILHEQPNKGRTVIEKFEDYSDVVLCRYLAYAG